MTFLNRTKTSVKYLLCALIALLYATISTAQQVSQLSPSDPFLHNGRVYNYFTFKTLGHQYFESPDFMPGEAKISGIRYENLLLNYDIFNQLVLLRFRSNRENQTIIIPNEKLNTFSLENRNFTLIKDISEIPVIYEQIGQGTLKMLFHYHKNIDVYTNDEMYDFTFSNIQKSVYLFIGGTQTRIRGKRDFLRFFDDPPRTEIRKFMRTEKIRFRKATNKQMEKLINYCNTIIN